MPTPLEEMRIVAKKLQPLDTPFAFVGGAVMCLLVDHPELTQFRRTKDVDVVVEIVTYAAFSALEAKLRLAGFLHDTSAGAPIVRWVVDGFRVDIMPQDSSSLGMNTRWFPEALRLAVAKDLGEDCSVRCVSPAVFMATKFEAYKDRGKGDIYLSHDLEDIVTLVDGRATIVEEVDRLGTVATEARSFIIGECSKLMGDRYFPEAILEHLPRLLGAQERAAIVLERFDKISKLSVAG